MSKQNRKRKKKRDRGRTINVATIAPSSRRATFSWVTFISVLASVVTLLSGAGLVALRPQLSMSAQELLSPGNAFSAPFELTNNGVLGVHVAHVIVVYDKVVYGTQLTASNKSGQIDWDDFTLESEGSKTLFATFSNGQPTQADMFFAVYYDVWGIPMPRKLFRFQGSYVQNWHWSKQPVDRFQTDRMLKESDETVALHMDYLKRKAAGLVR